MIRFSTLIARLLIFFYLSSSVVSAAHIHNPTQKHHDSDCKVCIVVKNIQSGDVPLAYTLNENLFSNYVVIFRQEELLSTHLPKGFNAQAPPVLTI